MNHMYSDSKKSWETLDDRMEADALRIIRESPEPPRRMYEDSAGSLNFYVGCTHNCLYCVPSFQRLLFHSQCQRCRDYAPHPHLERLNRPPPRTDDGQFIFFPSCSDWAMIPPEAQYQARLYMNTYEDTTFLLQTKDPRVFAGHRWPDNAILGITLETNRSTRDFSNAPEPVNRYAVFRDIEHPRKMLTVEPIVDFDMDTLAAWIADIAPWRTYVGYNSRPKEVRLPEPPLAKTTELLVRLREAGVDVRTKLMRVSQ